MSNYSKFDGNVLNPPHKKLRWFNRNLYYISTIAIVALLCVCHFLFKSQLEAIVESNLQWNVLLMPLIHKNIGNLIGNIIFFVIISIFLERHFGSFKYIFLTAFSFPLSSIAIYAFNGSWTGTGFTGVDYFMLALLVIVILYNFKGYIWGKCRWIFPIIILALCCLCACWNGSANWPEVNIGFGFFSNLFKNWEPCAMGGLVGLFTIFATFVGKGKQKKGVIEETKKSKSEKKADKKIEKAQKKIEEKKPFLKSSKLVAPHMKRK